jgi:CheY-like chemotaxis protein
MQAEKASNTRLLIVEDDGDLHELFARIARREGYEVVSAWTGEEALSIFRSGQRIDWLLTDVRLPGVINGWIVGSEFSLTHPLRPVIYISGVENDSECRSAASIFLQKPVMIHDLIKTFQRMSALADARA